MGNHRKTVVVNDYVQGERPGWPLIFSAALTAMLMADWWKLFGFNRFWIGMIAGLAIGFLMLAVGIAPRRIPVQMVIQDRREGDDEDWRDAGGSTD